MLIANIIPLVFGVKALVNKGKPTRQREGEPQLLGFEKSSTLVTAGNYRYIRHPLYSSLMLLTWGIYSRISKVNKEVARIYKSLGFKSVFPCHFLWTLTMKTLNLAFIALLFVVSSCTPSSPIPQAVSPVSPTLTEPTQALFTATPDPNLFTISVEITQGYSQNVNGLMLRG